MAKVYVVIDYVKYEGYGAPTQAYTTRQEATEFVLANQDHYCDEWVILEMDLKDKYNG